MQELMADLQIIQLHQVPKVLQVREDLLETRVKICVMSELCNSIINFFRTAWSAWSLGSTWRTWSTWLVLPSRLWHLSSFGTIVWCTCSEPTILWVACSEPAIIWLNVTEKKRKMFVIINKSIKSPNLQ